jgi:putative transposase
MKRELPKIRRVSDDLWAKIASLLRKEKVHGTRGRPPSPSGRSSMAYSTCSGRGAWKTPKSRVRSTCHRSFEQWVRAGVFERIWVKLRRYGDVQGDQVEVTVVRLELRQGASRGWKPDQTHEKRQARDGDTYRLTREYPLSAVIAGANIQDVKATFDTLDSVVVERRVPGRVANSTSAWTKSTTWDRDMRNREDVRPSRAPGGCSMTDEVVQTREMGGGKSASWLNRFRKLLIRWEKKVES